MFSEKNEEDGVRDVDEAFFSDTSPSIIPSVSSVEDYPENEFDEDLSEKASKIESAVEAFTSLDTAEKADKVTEAEQEGTVSIPKASENFPFGAKKRPVRERFDLKLMTRLRSLTKGKALWTNAGPVIVLVLFLFCMIYVIAERPYIMRLNGEPIAYVQTKDTGRKLLEQANLEISAPYPVETSFHQYAVIDYVQDGVQIKTKPTDEQTILDKLKTDITWFVDAWAISVNNERTVYLATKSMAEEVLERVKRSYLPEGEGYTITDIEFVEPVEIIQEEIPASILIDQDQAFRTLTEGKEPIREYKVQSGDSYWTIAERNNMTVEELKLMNGAVSDRLSIGQILKLNIPKPLLSVKTRVSEVLQEAIPFDTVYQSNRALDQGQSNVLTEGIDGQMEVRYEIAQINGYTVERNILSETVIQEPIDRVVESGTKTLTAAVAASTITASRGNAEDILSSALVWPIRSTVNSPFGERSRGFHSGIDIQAKTGDPVYSAGGGVVISANNFAGYGNQVTIDHGNGLTTMYAHLSQIDVTVGQYVGQQYPVGLAGSTGRTTGPHLHFEVRINGSPVNPINYLH